jgi:hypothetical protein
MMVLVGRGGEKGVAASLVAVELVSLDSDRGRRTLDFSTRQVTSGAQFRHMTTPPAGLELTGWP